MKKEYMQILDEKMLERFKIKVAAAKVFYTLI